MYCNNCGYENIKDSNFCSACGAPLFRETVSETASARSLQTSRPFVYPEGAYAYAKILSSTIREYKSGPVPSYYCQCIDGQSSFFVETRHASKGDLIPATIGDYIWVQLKQKSTNRSDRYHSVRVVCPNTANPYNALRYEFHTFASLFKEGMKIMAPVIEDKGKYMIVGLGPLLRAKATKPNRIQYALAEPGQIGSFEITQISCDDNVSVQLNYLSIVTDTASKQKPTLVPGSMQEVHISPNTLTIVEAIDDQGQISQIMGAPLTKDTLKEFLEMQYRIESQAKRVILKEDKSYYYMDFDLGIRNKKNVPLHAGFKKKKHSNKLWEMNLFGFASCQVERELDRFVYVENMPEHLNDLSSRALQGEIWDYPGEQGNNRILEQYLRCVFYKSRVDNLIVENSCTGDAVFNTGLVDGSYDDIYCFLKKNTHITESCGQKWELGFFACWGKGRDGKVLNGQFVTKPLAPQYIDANSIQSIYFDATKSLACDYDHIIRDNIARLPIAFIRRKLSGDTAVAEAITQYEQTHSPEDLDLLKTLIVGNEDRLRRIVDGLRTAVSSAQKRCRGNYKMAVPVYYPRNNAVSLLLPLSLTEGSKKADAALVVERLSNGNYQGHTILTMQMAYLDARMICRPDTPWLQLENSDCNAAI